MNFSARFRKMRESLNLKQTEFAEPLGIDRSYIAAIENGSRKPSEQLLRHLSLEYGVSVTWLKTGEGEMFITPEEALKKQKTRYGEQALIQAINNIFKQTSAKYSTPNIHSELFAVFNNAIEQYGETAVIEVFQSIMKEHGLVVAAGRQAHRANAGDPELDRLINTLYDLWTTGDEKFKGWIEVQFNLAFPSNVVAEAQKKQQQPHEQTFVG